MNSPAPPPLCCCSLRGRLQQAGPGTEGKAERRTQLRALIRSQPGNAPIGPVAFSHRRFLLLRYLRQPPRARAASPSNLRLGELAFDGAQQVSAASLQAPLLIFIHFSPRASRIAASQRLHNLYRHTVAGLSLVPRTARGAEAPQSAPKLAGKPVRGALAAPPSPSTLHLLPLFSLFFLFSSPSGLLLLLMQRYFQSCKDTNLFPPVIQPRSSLTLVSHDDVRGTTPSHQTSCSFN